jgi:ERCC4-type nuclease
MTKTFEPPPFVIVYDTREIKPFPLLGFAALRKTLKTGDYSIQGLEDRVTVERKSVADLWGSMTTGRARFERCVRRMAEMDRAAIVIEGSLTQAAIQPSRVERVVPASVIGGLISWSCQFALPVWFCETREQAERVTVRWLASYFKHRGGVQ